MAMLKEGMGTNGLPEELRWLHDDLALSVRAQRSLRRLGIEASAHFPRITTTITKRFASLCTEATHRAADCPYTAEWFRRLFSGTYEQAFWEEQLLIGERLATASVPDQVLPQVFMTLRTLLLAQKEDAILPGRGLSSWSNLLRVLDACQYVQHFGLERERRHTVLRQLRGLLQLVDFESFFSTSAQLACGIAKADGAGLILREEGMLRYRFFHGLSARYQDLGQWEFPETEGVSGAALARGEPVYVPDYPGSPWAMQEFVTAGLRASLAIPLPGMADEPMPGVLVISWFQQPAPQRIPEANWDHLRLLADLLGANLYRERLEHRMEGLATQDLLTGLPNRRIVQERLRAAMSRSDRHQRLAALFFLDLDGFKPINDQLGHHCGDDVLCTIASQLCAIVRAEDCVIRYAGDEFLVILEDIANVEEVECIASRLLQAAQCSVADEQTRLQVSASMGAVIYPFSDGSAEELIRQADLAMYAAKDAGGNTWKLFGRDLVETQPQEESLYQELILAQERKEFELLWQPIINLSDHTISGVEALLHWRHPERGLLGPGEILAPLERSRMILEVGHWVLKTALAQAASWQIQGNLLDIHINLSAVQLEDADFVSVLQQALAEHPSVDCRHIWLEVAERVALRDIPATASVIRAARRLGVHFTLQDYNSGIAALQYLTGLACDGIKLDRDMMRGMAEPSPACQHVRAVMDVASDLSLQVVAEGVEDEEMANTLRDLGVHKAQGHWFSPPVSAAELQMVLVERKVTC